MTRYEWLNLYAQLDLAQLIEKLSPYINDARRQRIETTINQRLSSIEVAIEEPTDPHNAAAIVRSAEALGILNVHVIKQGENILNKKSVTQGAFYWVKTLRHHQLTSFLNAIKLSSKCLVGAVVAADDSNVLSLAEIPLTNPVCILLGNESVGLSVQAKQACDYLYTIPSFGMSESFNLSVAGAISLYQLAEKKRKLMGKTGDLNDDEKLQERAYCYARSVNRRLFNSICKKVELAKVQAHD